MTAQEFKETEDYIDRIGKMYLKEINKRDSMVVTLLFFVLGLSIIIILQ